MLQTSHLADVLDVLLAARAEPTRDTFERAFAALASMYAALPLQLGSEAGAHVAGLYDTCLLALGRARHDDPSPIDAAIGLLRALARTTAT